MRCQLASEEDSTLTLSETKFDLEKFKSYLNAFNTNTNINQYRQTIPTTTSQQFQQRSTSMPPPLGKINNNYNQYQEQDRLLNTYENDRYGVRSINPTNGRTGTVRRLTAYNNNRNFGFLEEQSMRKPAPWKSTAASSASVSDSEEPIWTYRDQPQVSSNNVKRSSQSQPQTPQKSTTHSNVAASKRFGCGLFNKSSRLSVKLEEDEEDDDNDDDEENENDGFDENETERLNLKECSEFSNRSLQMAKSPRFDHLSLSHVNIISNNNAKTQQPKIYPDMRSIIINQICYNNNLWLKFYGTFKLILF